MENKKTVSYLNSKWWYRLIKVIFIVVFLIVEIMAVAAIYEINSPRQIFDNDSSYVLCDDGRKLGLDENNVTLYSPYMYSFEEDNFKRACAYNPEDPVNINPDNAIDLARLTPPYKNFQLIAKYTAEGSYFKVIGLSLLSIFGVYLVFEVIRRIFYYIVLGTFIPSRSESNK